jgi:hypothetical protein
MRLSAVRGVVLATVALLLGAVGATAFACSNLATIILSTGRGRAGATVTLTGASFIYPRATTGQQPTKVVVHWQSEDGAVLAEAVPDRFGSISATFTVPEAPPGIYVITATQLTPRVTPGAPADAAPTFVAELGTPARASFEVVGPGAPTVVRAPTTEPVAPSSGDLDSTVWIVLTAAFGAVALSLFGGGLVAFIHQSRQAKVPAEARWVPPGWYS